MIFSDRKLKGIYLKIGIIEWNGCSQLHEKSKDFMLVMELHLGHMGKKEGHKREGKRSRENGQRKRKCGLFTPTHSLKSLKEVKVFLKLS